MFFSPLSVGAKIGLVLCGLIVLLTIIGIPAGLILLAGAWLRGLG